MENPNDPLRESLSIPDINALIIEVAFIKVCEDILLSEFNTLTEEDRHKMIDGVDYYFSNEGILDLVYSTFLQTGSIVHNYYHNRSTNLLTKITSMAAVATLSAIAALQDPEFKFGKEHNHEKYDKKPIDFSLMNAYIQRACNDPTLVMSTGEDVGKTDKNVFNILPNTFN